MGERDVERELSCDRFVETLRRLADALEASASFRIQVASKRLTIPKDGALSVEHEMSDGAHELELQLKWTDA